MPKRPHKRHKQYLGVSLTRDERILDDWPRTAEEALQAVERYDHIRRKFSARYDFSLQFFLMPVAQDEVEAVLHAKERLLAAGELIARKINRWG